MAAEHARVAIDDRRLPPPPWRWMDDTNMALSVVEVLIQHGGVEPDSLAEASLAATTGPRPWPPMHRVLHQIGDGTIKMGSIPYRDEGLSPS
jgi:hypothetical protein